MSWPTALLWLAGVWAAASVPLALIIARFIRVGRGEFETRRGSRGDGELT